MEKLPWWSFWIPLLAVAWACNQAPEPADVAPQLDRDVAAAIEHGLIGAEDPGEDRAMPIGSATVLPAGCEIWVVSKTKEWKLPPAVYRVELRSPDGPTQVGYMEDGAVEVHCFGMQGLRFGGMNRVDDVLRLELSK